MKTCQKPPPPLVLYQRLKSGGGAMYKTEKFHFFEHMFSAARLLAPYALITDIGQKGVWSKKKSRFFGARGAIWRGVCTQKPHFCQFGVSGSFFVFSGVPLKWAYMTILW